MPRIRRTNAQRWADIVNVLMLPNGVYNLLDNGCVYCTYCTANIETLREDVIRDHHFSKLHVDITALQATNAEPSEDARAECSSRTHAFYYDMAEAFMAADIPFEKLNNAKFLEFLERNMKRRIPDPSTLRKTYVNLVYEKNMQQVRDEIGDHPVYISVDETNDSLGRLITHAIVAPLIQGRPGIPRMIHCEDIEVGDAPTIAGFVEESLRKLWPDEIKREKVLLFVTDAAPYMMAAGPLLKNNYGYCKLVHVSCLAHGLHRVAEEIRGSYPLVNRTISETKLVFLKAPLRKRLFHQLAPRVPLPPQPVITRWGEWLKAATYYHNYFARVQRVIRALPANANVVAEAQALWETFGLQTEFDFIHTHYCAIAEAIKALEKRGLLLEDSMEIITRISALIQRDQAIPANIKEKMFNVLNNNSGFSIDILNIFQCLQGVPNINLPNGWTRADVNCMTHAPTTSCEVERSFSNFKNILRPNRQSFHVENLEKYMVVYFNQLQYVEEEEQEQEED